MIGMDRESQGNLCCQHILIIVYFLPSIVPYTGYIVVCRRLQVIFSLFWFVFMAYQPLSVI